MNNLKDDKLSKVSGGVIGDDVLLTWRMIYQYLTSKKRNSTILTNQYRLSQIDDARKYCEEYCSKAHIYFADLEYQDPTSGSWIPVGKE